jgi:hypothetical protein
MKVGLSYSRCILDIVEERVDINDVLVVVSRTDFDPNIDEQWQGIWWGYTAGGLSNPEWANWAHIEGAEDKFRAVTLQLWNDGKFHQPRKFGAYPQRRREFWLETMLISEEIEINPAVKSAWNNFQVIAGLTNTKMNKEYN